MSKKRKKKNNKDCLDEPLFETDEYFAFIAGYTPCGFPYGVTWEQMEEIDRLEGMTSKNDDTDEELPF